MDRPVSFSFLVFLCVLFNVPFFFLLCVCCGFSFSVKLQLLCLVLLFSLVSNYSPLSLCIYGSGPLLSCLALLAVGWGGWVGGYTFWSSCSRPPLPPLHNPFWPALSGNGKKRSSLSGRLFFNTYDKRRKIFGSVAGSG